MPYYVRAFCSGSEVPAVDAIIADLKSRGFNVRAEADDQAVLSSSSWHEFRLRYGADKQPIVVECSRDAGEGSLCRAECAEFVEQLNEAEKNPARDRCIDRVNSTKFIIACQLLSDMDDEGFNVNGEFLGYFVRHCGGLVQADGEGFYEGEELVVPTD